MLLRKSFSVLGESRRGITITTGVEFDTIAREWRMKWSPDHDKKSLQQVQETLNKFTTSLKQIDGVKSVQRIVCGGCLDYKVIVSLSADKFGAWVNNIRNKLHFCFSFDVMLLLMMALNLYFVIAHFVYLGEGQIRTRN